MFYNVENLFDCVHDTLKNDYEFLPQSARAWTPYRYHVKLTRIAQAIVASGTEHVPALVGLCEVENAHCLDDLTRHSPLREADYRYVMTDSPDERGVDVTLLYQRSRFKLLWSRSVRVPSEQWRRPPTRDILHVTGLLHSGDTLDVFVCHLPSRSGGAGLTEPYRLRIAGVLRAQADSLFRTRRNARIVIMGDFNDYPDNRSIREVLGARKPHGEPTPRMLYNLMDGRPNGTYRYRGAWGTLDQFIVSGSLLHPEGSIRTSYEQAQILAHPFLLQEDARYGGLSPFRTYQGMRYRGGYSDHLPICCDFDL
ncbi:MAG: endonuclease/exonuclease/phosphatase family protein [Bacteroidales bacterium]|nr:endonuclease/exonuclease/phosphatase family protein [Bacteroidales bacterium]